MTLIEATSVSTPSSKNRRGKKRKFRGQRLKVGDRIFEPYEDPQAVARLQRVKTAIWQGAGSLEAGYPLGRLWLSNRISDGEFQAGKDWATLKWRHSQIVGYQLPFCKAIDFNAQYGKALTAEPASDEIERVKERMEKAEDTLKDVLGPKAIVELNRVCVMEEEPLDRTLLQMALKAFAAMNAVRRK